MHLKYNIHNNSLLNKPHICFSHRHTQTLIYIYLYIHIMNSTLFHLVAGWLLFADWLFAAKLHSDHGFGLRNDIVLGQECNWWTEGAMHISGGRRRYVSTYLSDPFQCGIYMYVCVSLNAKSSYNAYLNAFLHMQNGCEL